MSSASESSRVENIEFIDVWKAEAVGHQNSLQENIQEKERMQVSREARDLLIVQKNEEVRILKGQLEIAEARMRPLIAEFADLRGEVNELRQEGELSQKEVSKESDDEKAEETENESDGSEELEAIDPPRLDVNMLMEVARKSYDIISAEYDLAYDAIRPIHRELLDTDTKIEELEKVLDELTAKTGTENNEELERIQELLLLERKNMRSINKRLEEAVKLKRAIYVDMTEARDLFKQVKDVHSLYQ